MFDFYNVFNIFNIITVVLCCVLHFYLSFNFIYGYQIAGYRVKKYFIYLKQNKLLLVFSALLSFVSFVFMFVANFVVYLYNLNIFCTYISVAIYCLLCFMFYKFLFIQQHKVPFNKTRRIKRFIFVFMLINSLLAVLILFLNKFLSIYFMFCLICLMPLLSTQIVVVVHLITFPFENMVKLFYILKCKLKLKRYKNLKVIAITGSSGKTSTKFILTKMLSTCYATICTPDSYNTPMGLTKTVNNNNLENIDFLVAEYGADRKNDIKRLCKIIAPNYSYITNIGNQHLKTFKTQQNLTKTKCQIYRYLKKDGIAFFNLDDKNVYNFSKGYLKRYINISLHNNCVLSLSNVKTTQNGSSFTLSDGKITKICKTVLLGEHNIQNIFASAVIAYSLEVSLLNIANAVKELQPSPHRLQLITQNPSLLVLDDTFNSNIEGFRQALHVLSQFKGKKAVVTPGIVELGKIQEKVNFEIATIIANIADFVIIVNKTNKATLYNGLVSAGFKEENIFYFNTLFDAQQKFTQILKNVSVVLMENDLPDEYE